MPLDNANYDAVTVELNVSTSRRARRVMAKELARALRERPQDFKQTGFYGSEQDSSVNHNFLRDTKSGMRWDFRVPNIVLMDVRDCDCASHKLGFWRSLPVQFAHMAWMDKMLPVQEPWKHEALRLWRANRTITSAG